MTSAVRMRGACGWLAGFVLAGLLAPTAAGLDLDRWVAGVLRGVIPVAVRLQFSRLLPYGRPEVLLGALLVLTVVRRLTWAERVRAWAGTAAAVALEIGCKHLGFGAAVAGPLGGWSVQAPRWLQGLSGPAARAWGGVLRAVQPRGGFPSGHVLRLTLLGGYLLPAPGWWAPGLAAALGGVATVATGAHSVTDVLGGACLAFAVLVGVGRAGR